MGKVFICCRREQTAGEARALHGDLLGVMLASQDAAWTPGIKLLARHSIGMLRKRAAAGNLRIAPETIELLDKLAARAA